jgi:mediator of RNA polymerase II transcription subunit 15
MDKVKQLEKYIAPLRLMITKIGTEDQDRLQKMKKLLEILSNPEKRMPLATLQKCEDVLKKMNLPDIETEGPEGGVGRDGCPSSLNPLLEAVLKARPGTGAQLNHSLSRTFLPPLRAVVGQEITLAPLPPSPMDSEEEDEIPDVLQGEIARLQPRFKVWLSAGQPSGQAGGVRVVCQLDDQDLPAVPTIEVTLPGDYPARPPVYTGEATDHLVTPFLARVEAALESRLALLPARHTLSQVLTASP